MRPSHFVALPLWHNAQTVQLTAELIDSLSLPIEARKNRDGSVQATRYVKPVGAESIHLTVGITTLSKDKEPSIGRALEIIASCRDELAAATGGQGHRVLLDRIGHFPEAAGRHRARVLFVAPSDAPGQSSSILELARIVNDRLAQAGLLNTGRPNQNLNVRV